MIGTLQAGIERSSSGIQHLKPFLYTSNNTSSRSGGIGFTGLLTITFIVLKLTGIIHWSWWWVLSPIWIVAIIWLLFIVGILFLIRSR